MRRPSNACFSGGLLYFHRHRVKLSRLKLSKKINGLVGTQTIKNYELDIRVPNVNTALRLAEALGIGLEALLDAES